MVDSGRGSRYRLITQIIEAWLMCLCVSSWIYVLNVIVFFNSRLRHHLKIKGFGDSKRLPQNPFFCGLSMGLSFQPPLRYLIDYESFSSFVMAFRVNASSLEIFFPNPKKPPDASATFLPIWTSSYLNARAYVFGSFESRISPTSCNINGAFSPRDARYDSFIIVDDDWNYYCEPKKRDQYY